MSDDIDDADDVYYRAIASRDARFDGKFFTAVTTTGIYCRPICPARTPKRENVRYFRVAAAAEAAGFRACRRCRPELSPGAPEWDVRADLSARALRLIAAGVADDGGVSALAQRLNVSERHLHRTLVEQVGVGPQGLARTRRAQTARVLIESTALPVADIAFTAGYSSIRQFNDSIRQAFGRTPSELRARAELGRPAGAAVDSDGALVLRLTYRPPLDLPRLLDWFGTRAVPGVEEVDGLALRRAVRLRHGAGLLRLSPADGTTMHAEVSVTDLRDVTQAVRICRDLLDLDADPETVRQALDGAGLGALLARRPGLRIPGCADGFELAVRAVLGQQVSVAAARTFAARIVRAAGTPLARIGFAVPGQRPLAGDVAAADLIAARAAAVLDAERDWKLERDLAVVGGTIAGSPRHAPSHPGASRNKTRSHEPGLSGEPGAVTRSPGAATTEFTGSAQSDGVGWLFPTAAELADADLSRVGLTTRREATLRALAVAVAKGEIALDRGADRAETRAALRSLPGIGPWTAEYVALRALGDPDAFPSADLGLLHAAKRLGLPDEPRALAAAAHAWQPWRGYATMHLWASLDDEA